MKKKITIAMMLCFFASAALLGQGQRQGGAQQPAGPEKPTVASEIRGVVKAGTKVERVWTGMKAADGLISEPDGTLLLPEQRANRVSKFDKNGKITPYLDDTNEAGGFAIDSKGRLVGVERNMPTAG